MVDAYKWVKEYHEGREAAQRGEYSEKNPYYHIDSSDEDMVRGYHWRNGWWDEMHIAIKEPAA
jgi:hypothetical protein